MQIQDKVQNWNQDMIRSSAAADAMNREVRHMRQSIA